VGLPETGPNGDLGNLTSRDGDADNEALTNIVGSYFCRIPNTWIANFATLRLCR
jgi:hypothetical protein